MQRDKVASNLSPFSCINEGPIYFSRKQLLLVLTKSAARHTTLIYVEGADNSCKQSSVGNCAFHFLKCSYLRRLTMLDSVLWSVENL